MERYRDKIDEWEELLNSVKEPSVKSIRRNRIKSEDDISEKLREEFEKVEQPDWNPEVYRLPRTEKPGKTILHWLGKYYVQEESATLPVEILEPETDDSILDMCAAPGGKTTQIASKVENKGEIIANDKSRKRLKSLYSNIYRTGSACVKVTNQDGRNFPGRGKFDKILLDAPCSGEADRARRAVEKAEYEEKDPEEALLSSGASHEEIKNLAEVQKKLLERASELLKPSGTLVYSTCTFTPEENEKVVKHGMEETELRLEKIKTECPHENGWKNFDGEKISDQMEKTVRVYPHNLRSGGIYVAKFTK